MGHSHLFSTIVSSCPRSPRDLPVSPSRGPLSLPPGHLGRGQHSPPQNPRSFRLIPYLCSQHPTLTLVARLWAWLGLSSLVLPALGCRPEKLRRGWDRGVSRHREGSAGVRRPQAPLGLPGGHTGRNPAVLVTSHTKRTPCFSPLPLSWALRSRGTVAQGHLKGRALLGVTRRGSGNKQVPG